MVMSKIFYRISNDTVSYPATFCGCRFFNERSEEKNRFAAGESGDAVSRRQWEPGAKSRKIFVILHSE